MATALYRRYRSARFGDLVGQDVIAATLRHEVRDGNLAHAYLFTGIRGTGKTSTARILARAVNCLEPDDGEPCNRCAPCLQILDGSSVDVLEIDAASNRGIDEMRDLREKVKYLPASLRRKVYIIDEAHMLTTEAWNAFLKTLEEPPAHVLFVLATTEPHKVPETVRSRVQRFDFRRVATSDLEGHLAAVLAAEATQADADGVALLARAAQGSVRDALSMLDQALAGGERPLRADHVRRALGLADSSTVHGLLTALAGADGPAALRAVAAAFDAGADPRQLLQETARLARAVEFAALGHPEGAEIGEDEAELVQVLARVAPLGFWLRVLELVQVTAIELRQPVDARLQVEFCVMRLLREGGLVAEQLAAVEERVARLEQRLKVVSPSAPVAHGGASPTPPLPVIDVRASHATADAAASPAAEVPARNPQQAASTAAPPTASGPADVALGAGAADDAAGPADGAAPRPPAATAPSGSAAVDVWQERWPLLLEAVNRRDAMLAGVLRGCRPLSADADSLVVGAPYRFHLDKLRDRAPLAVLSEAAGEVAGTPFTVTAAFCGEDAETTRRPGTTGEITQAVLDTFSGSRVTSTRLRDEAIRPPRGGAA